MLYLSADMDLSDLVKPRLVQAGADLSRIYAVNDTFPVTLGDDSMEQIVENYDIRMVIIGPVQEYLEYDVYQDLPATVYPVLVKLEKLAKKSGCAVVLIADTEGAGSSHGNAWKNVFVEKTSSVLCLERHVEGSGVVSLINEKCILASEGKVRMIRLFSAVPRRVAMGNLIELYRPLLRAYLRILRACICPYFFI